MRLWITVAIVLTVGAPLPALAYTQEDVDACRPDSIRLCQQAYPDVSRVVLCLVRNKSRLGPACTLAFNRVRSEIVSNEHPARVQQTKY
jgi:hypothetical protein